MGRRGEFAPDVPHTAVPGRLEREVEALADLDRSDLIEHWRRYFRTDPPKGIGQRLLIRAVAYEMQVKRYGGLKPATDRRLQKIANGTSDCAHNDGKAPRGLHPGARLVREWNGVSHVVEVTEHEFVWDGERYRSLSAIARAITGARWSGPRFFGLTSENAS
jgi:hypothetical protein